MRNFIFFDTIFSKKNETDLNLICENEHSVYNLNNDSSILKLMTDFIFSGIPLNKSNLNEIFNSVKNTYYKEKGITIY